MVGADDGVAISGQGQNRFPAEGTGFWEDIGNTEWRIGNEEVPSGADSRCRVIALEGLFPGICCI